MDFFLSTLIGYLLGSIPTAYLILKKSKGIDIRKEGSKNVGTRNVYRVSKSKLLTASVLIIDLGKGALSAIIPILIFGPVFIYPAIASLFAIFAHCFNPWIEFRGGRGLATAAGTSIVIFPYLLVVWLVLWGIFFAIKKNIAFSNISATIMSIILVFNTEEIAIKYSNPAPESISNLILFVISILLLIFIKHIDRLSELIYNKKIFRIKK